MLSVSPLLAVVGPTGSGKSALALFLAQVFDAEILNCDSLQVYRYFDIGTAKASREDLRIVPHHLIDAVDPDQVYTAGEFARDARRIAVEIASRGRIPIVVGGTGFYLRAMLDGLSPSPARDEALRQRLQAREQQRPGSLHRLLRRLDPAAGQRIHPNDTNKTIRALELRILARRPAAELFEEGGTPPLEGFEPVLLGLDPPRQALYDVLNARCEHMFAAGLKEEVRDLLTRFGPHCKPFEAIGYKETVQLLQETITFSEALEQMQRQTRHYAKRQWTWFKRDTRVSWIPGFGHLPETQQIALETIRNKSPRSQNFLLSSRNKSTPATY
ncbi:MAG: tRNA (adenosine(37)-N6)-dimethylallyltransferase MiaA [Bryobacterales bacterium]|nr:tRNA (adenosine(37)-N6)-dimethylallyltransferase MiaA [Bryobacterales bacterium]